MAYRVTTVEVWAGDIYNRPGMLARVLEGLRNAGARLEFLVARRVNDDTGRVFVAPIKGKKQQQAARDLGLVPARGMFSLRIEGPDRDGLGADLTRAVADRGINIRGASAAALGKKTAIYLAFSREQELKEAVKAARRALRGRRT